MINNELVFRLFGIETPVFSVMGLGDISVNNSDDIVSFLSEEKYLKKLNLNKSIKAVFIKESLHSKVRDDIIPIIVDDPKWYFFKLVNYHAENQVEVRSEISESATIHSTAVISDVNVIVGDNVLIEANAVISSGVIIEDDVVIRAGAVLGIDGYEHKHTSKGIVSVAHDGKVLIKKGAEIGVNCNVAKGFSYRDTIVGEETKFDALVHYAHGAQCGARCMFVASAMIAGHVSLGNDVWVGPNASISNRVSVGNGAFITIGSVVVKDVGEFEKVTGNFAIPHLKFLRNLKASVK